MCTQQNKGRRNEKQKQMDEESDSEGNRKGFFTINRNTLPLKLSLLFYYGAMAAIVPYLTIHMKDLGLPLTKIGIIYAFLPITAFLGPPIMGMMADRFGQYKIVLMVATLITGVAHTSLLAVPKYSEMVLTSSAIIEFGIGASPSGAAVLRPQSIEFCDSFDKSLRLSGGNPFWNEMISVHSCQVETGSNSSGSPKTLGRSMGTGTVAMIPNLCKPTLTITNGTEEIIGYSCGNDSSTGREEVGIEMLSRSMPKRNKCSLKVRINSGDIQNFPSVTCQTNYTFPTGEKVTSGNAQLTFWLYFSLRTIGNIFMSSCFSLLDATTLAIVEKNKGSEFGRERILCTLGFALVSPIAGLLVDQVSKAKGYTDYSATFYLSNVLLALNLLGYIFMKLDVEKPNDNIWKNATDLLNYPEVVVFLGMIFALGNIWGFVESYIYIFLDELEAPKYLLGLTLTVSCLSSIPVLYGAGTLVAKVGRVNIIVLAFLMYFVRCLGYSFMPSPYFVFPMEVLEAFTYQLMWVAAATYCSVLAPKGLLATLTGVVASFHYGLGRGSGAFIGGHLINMTSTRLSFRYFGIASAIFGLIYFSINKCWLQNAIRKRKEREAEEQPDTEQRKAMLST